LEGAKELIGSLILAFLGHHTTLKCGTNEQNSNTELELLVEDFRRGLLPS
jgi:hypothetical protein